MEETFCVIGLGEVGLPSAVYIQKICHAKPLKQNKYHKVIGVDISEQACEKAKEQKIQAQTSIPLADRYIICVNDATKEMKNIFDICEKIWNLNNSCHVYIESTLRLGTSQKIHEKYPSFKAVAHCPHRYYANEPIEHGVKQVRVIGSTTPEGLMEAHSFYKDFLEIPVLPFGIRETEMCKITENAYRFLLISFAEELYMISKKLDLDYNELRSAINSKWNTKVLEARDGIGGACLPKDIGFVTSLPIDEGLLHKAIEIDERYRKYV